MRNDHRAKLNHRITCHNLRRNEKITNRHIFRIEENNNINRSDHTDLSIRT